MFRLMGRKSKIPTQFYPMSMVSYDLCPQPDFVEAGVGEQRNVQFTPISIAVMDEVPNVGGAEKRHLFTEKAEEECIDGYVKLLKGLDMERYIPYMIMYTGRIFSAVYKLGGAPWRDHGIG